LQAGIVESVLQRQGREPFKGLNNFLNFHCLVRENLVQR
jgi:hypothetical protein